MSLSLLSFSPLSSFSLLLLPRGGGGEERRGGSLCLLLLSSLPSPCYYICTLVKRRTGGRVSLLSLAEEAFHVAGKTWGAGAAGRRRGVEGWEEEKLSPLLPDFGQAVTGVTGQAHCRDSALLGSGVAVQASGSEVAGGRWH